MSRGGATVLALIFGRRRGTRRHQTTGHLRRLEHASGTRSGTHTHTYTDSGCTRQGDAGGSKKHVYVTRLR